MTFKRGDFVKEGAEVGIVLASGSKTFDVVWTGGSTSRYRYGIRDIHLATERDLEDCNREHLIKEAADAREERRIGAGVKRGQIWPSH